MKEVTIPHGFRRLRQKETIQDGDKWWAWWRGKFIESGSAGDIVGGVYTGGALEGKQIIYIRKIKRRKK